MDEVVSFNKHNKKMKTWNYCKNDGGGGSDGDDGDEGDTPTSDDYGSESSP
jgi:hypothetical protein